MLKEILRNTFRNTAYLLNKQSKFYFSDTKMKMRHPTIQKIMKGEDVTNINAILQEVGGMTSQYRQIALKLILKKILNRKLPPQIVQSPQFQRQSKKHHEIFIDSYLFIIKDEMHKLDALFQTDLRTPFSQQKLRDTIGKIDSMFDACFQQFKKLSEEKRMRSSVTIYKRFGDYYLYYVTPLQRNNQNKIKLLQQCCQVYRQAITASLKLIAEEALKIQTAQDLSPQEQDKQASQQRQFNINSLKQSVRILAQTNSQNILNLFKSLNQIYRLNKDQKTFNDGLVQTLSNLQRGIGLYKMLQNMKQHSIFYHRIRKLKAQINNHYKLLIKKDTPQIIKKQYIQELNQAYKQAQDDLEALKGSIQYISNINSITVVMMQLRMELERQANEKVEIQDIKEALLLEIKNILGKISNQEVRKIVAHQLSTILEQFVKTTQKMQNKKNVQE